MEKCAECGLDIMFTDPSCYEQDPFGKDDFGKTYHSECYGAKRDLEAARRALRDFEKRGGTTLEALKIELGLST